MKIEFLDTKRKCLVLGMICFISFLIVGMSRLSGLLFVACMARYQTGRKQASLPFIMGYTVRNISGPLVGYLGNKFSLVTITLLGCLLSATGVGACFFAEDIVAVIFLWGTVYGLGFGMGTCLIPLILSEYFTEHVDKANGVYTGGGCIAAFILPLIADKAIAEYGTSGMFLIFSGIILNSVPAAMLLKKPKNSIAKCNTNPNGMLKKITSENNLKISKSTQGPVHEEKIIISLEQIIESSGDEKDMSSETSKLFYTDIQQMNNKTENTYKPEPKHLKPFNATSNQNEKEAEVQFTEIKSIAEDSKTNFPEVSQDVAQSELNTKKSVEKNSHIYSKRRTSLSSPSNKEFTSNSFQVFLDVAYILILLVQGFMLTVISTIWTIIIDASIDKGITEQEGVYILMCMGITDMIGRFFLGYITDSGRMSKINFQILCAAGLGVFHILFIFLEGFLMVMISVGVFGLFTGGHIMIGVGIINQYIEKEYVTMAIASRYFAFTLMSFAQAPMIGFFRENLNSYNGLFILLAGICGISAVLTWFTPIAARRRDKRKQLR